MLKRIVSMLLLSFVIIASGCGNKYGQQASTNTNTPVATPKETPASSEPVAEAEPNNESFVIPDSSVRPVAVMIDNQGDKVLPQGGIAQAQIVYEMLVEYNITRYMALFWGTMPEMIGPVRSSRHYYLDYAMEYDAIYTHVGYSEYARKDIERLKLHTINGLKNGDAFWDLDKNKGNWQDTFTSKERIEKKISDLKYYTVPKKTFPFQYSQELVTPKTDRNAEEINIKFVSSNNTSSFIYDAKEKAYLRMRMGKPQIDRNTDNQVEAMNIIIQETNSPLIDGDSEGRRNLKNIGSGNGWYITCGKAVPITWTKKARSEQTQYLTEDGKPLVLNCGQTWIEIVPKLDDVQILPAK